MSIDQARQTVEVYAGLSPEESARLVEAAVLAARREALEWIAGDAPIPTNMPDARALRLRYICEELGRVLRPREIEVIFRTSPTGAASIDTRMRSTYARAVDEFLRRVVRESATVRQTGDAESGFRYEIYFDEAAGLEYAKQLLDRNGLRRDIKVRRPSQTLDLPREINDTNVLDVLGLEES